MAASPTAHAAFESSGPGGKLHWSERRDGHWHADAPGGHFDVVPMARGYHLWFRGQRGTSYVDLGHHGSLGGAFAAARYYLDEPAAAEAGAKAAEESSKAECCGDEKCAHRHPPQAPSLPCNEAKEELNRITWKRLKDGLFGFVGDASRGKPQRKYVIKKHGKTWEIRARGTVGPILGEGYKSESEAKSAADKIDREMHPDLRASEASLDEAPPPMHVQIPPDAYAQWVAYGDAVGPVDTTEKVYRLLSPYTHKHDQEVFLVVVTDLHFKLRSVTEVARGERSMVGVGIEEVMRAALMTPGGASFVVAHNHPTSKCRPSEADKKLHRDIESASKTYASLKYLDHVVIGVGEFYSIREGKMHKVRK